MEDYRSGFVTIIGRPNVGKSTLLNALVGQKIAITSDKPQTTRNRMRGIHTDDRGQIIFLDTPGITQPRNSLGEYMELSAIKTVNDVDIIIYVVEASDYIGAADRRIIDMLSGVSVPVFLAINKIDTIKKEEVLPVIDAFSHRYDFDEIIPISARKKDGIKDLLDSIYDRLPQGPAYYDEDYVTDSPVRSLVSEIIREKALKALSEEVPHGIAVAIDTMKKKNKKSAMAIEATIVCEKESHKGIIIGRGGVMIKKIGSAARRDIENLLEEKVNLTLFVKVKKNWRESDFLVKNFGYDKREL